MNSESALSYNWRRTYDPVLGRYLQSDPIGLAGGINSYAYVNGNPLIYTDPEGAEPRRRGGDWWCGRGSAGRGGRAGNRWRGNYRRGNPQ